MFIKNSCDAPYKFTPESIGAKIRLLADDQRSTLEMAAKCTYPNQNLHLKGDAYNFDELEIIFVAPCPENTPMRRTFVKRITTRLTIEEDYEMDANLSDNISNKLAIDQRHLSPNLIKKNFSDKLTIKEYGDRKYISMMEDSRREGSNSDQDSMNIGPKIGYGLFSIRASYCIVKKNGEKWKNGDYSFNEQLNDLNRASPDSVKCGIEGTLVILKMFQFLALVNDMVVSHKKRRYRVPILSHEIDEALSKKLACEHKFIRSHKMVCKSGTLTENVTKYRCRNASDFSIYANHNLKCCKYEFVYEYTHQAALNNLAADSAQAAVDDAARRQRVEQARNERRQAQPSRQELLKERHESWNAQAKQEHAEFLRASGKQRVVQPVAAAQSQ
uniref:Uncharacterized protein n=1 Tax=Romanomermis culicivorax TaxID=13658 RepID=A0A915HZS0_ROMCU